jgi:hypothetical protein
VTVVCLWSDRCVRAQDMDRQQRELRKLTAHNHSPGDSGDSAAEVKTYTGCFLLYMTADGEWDGSEEGSGFVVTDIRENQRHSTMIRAVRIRIVELKDFCPEEALEAVELVGLSGSVTRHLPDQEALSAYVADELKEHETQRTRRSAAVPELLFGVIIKRRSAAAVERIRAADNRMGAGQTAYAARIPTPPLSPPPAERPNSSQELFCRTGTTCTRTYSYDVQPYSSSD